MRTCQTVDFSILTDHKEKIKESEKQNKYIHLVRELRKLWNRRVKVISIKETGRLRNQRTSEDHPDYSIVKINKNTQKSPGDLMRLAVT